MSSNICRNTYINYGSYLRSRGYDQQICTLVTDLDNGLLPISGFTFGGANSATFAGPITINSYSSNDGKLLVTGGENDNISNFSIRGLNGLFINGSFVQTTSNTTYSFTLRLTDAESQTTDRAFTITVTVEATGGGQFN